MTRSRCFVFAILLCLFNFAAVLCHMARGPRCLQTAICAEGRDVRLIADPFFRKQSDKVVTFSSAGPTFFWGVFNLQLERGTKWQSCLLFFLPPVMASYCNRRGGAVCTPQAILRLSRHCVHSCRRPFTNALIQVLILYPCSDFWVCSDSDFHFPGPWNSRSRKVWR